MIEQLINSLEALPKEVIVMIVAALPVAELRGSIPVALSFGFSIQKAFFWSVIGNTIPVIPVLFFFKPVSARLRKFSPFTGFFEWLEKRTLARSASIQKYEMLGLIIFVGIPLPMTGAWSGAIAASLLKMRLRYAFLGCFLGILLAGLIVSVLCQLGMIGWKAVAQ